MIESEYIKPFFHVRREHSDGTVIETMHEPQLPKYVWVAIWNLYDENCALRKRLASVDKTSMGE